MKVDRFTGWITETLRGRCAEHMTVRTFAEVGFDRSRYGMVIRTPSGGWAFVQCASTGGPSGDPVITGPLHTSVPPATVPPGSPTLVGDIEAWIAGAIADADPGEAATIDRYSLTPGLGLHDTSHGIRVVYHSRRTIYLLFNYLLSADQRVRPSALFAAPASI